MLRKRYFWPTRSWIRNYTGFGDAQRLARIIGIGMAKQMIYTAQNIKSEENLRIGLVNAIYPQNELLNKAKKLAKTIANNSLNAVKNNKKAINEGIELDMDKSIQIEEKYFGECFETSEQKERMYNFLNKNKSKSKKIEKKEVKEIEEMPKGVLKLTNVYPKNMFMIDKDLILPEIPAILTSGDKNSYNSMVIGHGSLGVGYGKPIFTVYVKPERYTYEFMERTKIFTISYIDKRLYKKFVVYGTKSGRDINKEEVSGPHIVFMDNGGITFEEVVEVYVCKLN